MLSNLNQLRSQIERCSLLLREIEMDKECGRDVLEHVNRMNSDIHSLITNTNKSLIIVKNQNAIPIEPVDVKPAPLLHSIHVDEAELLELQNAYDIQEKERSKRRKEREIRRTIVYHPEPKMHQLIKLHQEMGGVSLETLIKPFVPTIPEIELYDILDFLKKLKHQRETKNLYKDTGVYIHLCEYGTFYVGISKVNFENNGTRNVEESVRQRLSDHRNWHDCKMRANWTGVYPIVSMIFFMNGDKEDERLLTLLLNKCLPKSKVRGSIYTNIGHESIPDCNVKYVLNALSERS